jgi:hypothetical protein
MTEENKIPQLDNLTVEFITRLFQDTLKGIHAQVEERISSLEDSIESIEKQVATLVLGYGEQAIFMEALVAQLAFATDEARQAFQKDVTQARKDMLEVMNGASKGFMAEQDPNLASAIADVVENQLHSTDS